LLNDPPTPEIYTLSLHDALPIWECSSRGAGARTLHPRPSRPPGPGVRLGASHPRLPRPGRPGIAAPPAAGGARTPGCLSVRFPRSEEHTSELQSRENLVCRLLLE